MTRASAWFCRSAILLCNIAAMSFVFSVASFGETGRPDVPCTYVWLAFVMAFNLLLAMLSGKERSLRSVLTLAAEFFAAQCVICFVFAAHPAGFGAVLFMLLFWLLSYYRGYLLVKNGVKQEQAADNFDLSVFILLISVACGTMTQLDASIMYLPSAACALSLAALICARSANGRRENDSAQAARGSTLIVIAVLAAAGLAAGATALLAEPVKRALIAVLHAILAALKWFADAMIRFLMLLAPKDKIPGAASLEELEGGVSGGSADADIFLEVDWIPKALVIALIALMVIAIIVRFVMGGRGLSGTFGGAKTKRTRSANARSLREIFAAFMRRTATFFHSVVYRNTARGLFAWLLQRGRVTRISRGRGETPRSYLLRVADKYPQNYDMLSRLADLLDDEYFGSGLHRMSAHEAAAMRRALASGFSRGKGRGAPKELTQSV